MATLFDLYHLQDEEEKAWDLAAIEADTRAQDPAFPERVLSLFPTEGEKLAGSMESPLPSPLYSKLEALCRLYLSATPAQRLFIRSKVDRTIAGQVEYFGGQSAVLAIRSRSEDLARLAVVAHAIENLKSGDVRDTLIALTVVHHAAKTIGLDANALFCEIAQIAGAGVRQMLEDYARRHPDLQQLRMMGLYEVQTPDGVGFTMNRKRAQR